MEDDSGITTPVRTARDAIAGHIRWRIRLQFAIATAEPVSPEAMTVIRNSQECPIGKWLLSRDTAALRLAPEYTALVQRHEEFHHEMLVIAQLINTGRFDEAARGLNPESPYHKASRAIASAITALDRIHTITLPE